MSNNRVYESIMAGLSEALVDAQNETPILKRYALSEKKCEDSFNSDSNMQHLLKSKEQIRQGNVVAKTME